MELDYKTLARSIIEYSALSGVLITRDSKGPLKWFSVMRPVLYCFTTKERLFDTDMILQLQWDIPEQRRLKARTVMMYRIFHNLVMIPADQLIYSTVNTRGHDEKLRAISAKRNYYKFSFFPFGVPLELPRFRSGFSNHS